MAKEKVTKEKVTKAAKAPKTTKKTAKKVVEKKSTVNKLPRKCIICIFTKQLIY